MARSAVVRDQLLSGHTEISLGVPGRGQLYPFSGLSPPLFVPIEAFMGRLLGLPFLVISLAGGAYMFAQQSKSVTGATGLPSASQAIAQAQSAVESANLLAAVRAVESWYAQNETYAGAPLSPGSGATLVRADATGYCVQTGGGASFQHVAGPNGIPQPGPC